MARLNLGRYAKAFIALLVPALIAVQAGLSSPTGLHRGDILKIVIAALGPILVFSVPNTPKVDVPPAGGMQPPVAPADVPPLNIDPPR